MGIARVGWGNPIGGFSQPNVRETGLSWGKLKIAMHKDDKIDNVK